MEKTPLSSRDQIATVREVATIAADQARNALPRLLKVAIRICVPEVANTRISEILALFGGLDAPAIGVLVPFQRDMEGNTLLLFPEERMGELERMLLGSSGQAGDDLRLSAFAETELFRQAVCRLKAVQ